jgi:ABC-2 type transport system permease protein
VRSPRLDRTLAIARKETRQLLRDPAYLGLAVVVPLLLILLLGYQLSLDVKGLLLVVVDHDRSRWSREYIAGVVHSEYFRLVSVLESAEEARHWIRSGRARVVIDIPPDFGRRLSAGEPTTVGVTVDGSFPTRAQISAGYVEAISGLYNERLLSEHLARQGAGDGTPWPVRMDLVVWYNPTLESKNFVVPSMLVMILMIFPPLLSALLIVRERESGTILNLYCSPVGRWDILTGKALPYVVVSYVDFLLIFAVSIGLFRVRFVGAVWVLATGALFYSVCTVGLGLLISALTRTQFAAILATFLGVVTPAFAFSGIFTPTASLDTPGRVVSFLIPATYFMEVVRGCYLKGGGVTPYLPSLAMLVVYGALVYGTAWLALRKRLG